jgi:hypothetical protein
MGSNAGVEAVTMRDVGDILLITLAVLLALWIYALAAGAI